MSLNRKNVYSLAGIMYKLERSILCSSTSSVAVKNHNMTSFQRGSILSVCDRWMYSINQQNDVKRVMGPIHVYAYNTTQKIDAEIEAAGKESIN